MAETVYTLSETLYTLTLTAYSYLVRVVCLYLLESSVEGGDVVLHPLELLQVGHCVAATGTYLTLTCTFSTDHDRHPPPQEIREIFVAKINAVYTSQEGPEMGRGKQSSADAQKSKLSESGKQYSGYLLRFSFSPSTFSLQQEADCLVIGRVHSIQDQSTRIIFLGPRQPYFGSSWWLNRIVG